MKNGICGSDVTYLAKLLICGLATCALFFGCSSGDDGTETEASNLKPLAILYGRYIGQHQGPPPANEAEFKTYLNELSSEELAEFGITDSASLLISSRDKKPYVVLYGKGGGAAGIPGGPGGGSESDAVIAYEEEGVGGTRFVATSSLGAIEEADEARFKELVPDAQ